MKYDYSYDFKSVRNILNISQEILAEEIGVELLTIFRIESGLNKPSIDTLTAFYNFVYSKNINLNKLKEMFIKERLDKDSILLFYGSKNGIEGELSLTHSKTSNDFGAGLYAGESYLQAATYVAYHEHSRVYIFSFLPRDLKYKKYEVNNEWMLTIAYFRHRLDNYLDNPLIKEIASSLKDVDYIIAPIADNRMFQLIDDFIENNITDEQCKYTLAATNLGYQYVFLNEKALKKVKIEVELFLSKKEKEDLIKKHNEDIKLGDDKRVLAKIENKGKGKFLRELLNEKI